MHSIPITFLATISLSAVLAIAASAHVQAEEQAKPETAASQSDAETLTQPSGDYYSRRAEKILEKAAAGEDNKPHPLAKSYPEDFVIVCEAGCRERRAVVVSRERREAVKVGPPLQQLGARSDPGDDATVAFAYHHIDLVDRHQFADGFVDVEPRADRLGDVAAVA